MFDSARRHRGVFDLGRGGYCGGCHHDDTGELESLMSRSSAYLEGRTILRLQRSSFTTLYIYYKPVRNYMKNILAENMRRFRTKNLNEQTMPDPTDLMSNMMSNDAPKEKMFPTGTALFGITDRIDKSKTAQVAFIKPRNAKGPFTWKPFKSSAQPNALITSVQIEYREGSEQWTPATLSWVSNAPYLLLIKLADGTNQSNFENKTVQKMFQRAYDAHLKTPPATTQDADAI